MIKAEEFFISMGDDMQGVFDVTGVILKTDRLLLREFQPEDLEDFHEYAKVPGVGEMAGWAHHESIAVSREILHLFLASKKTFAITKNGKVIGSLGVEFYGESWNDILQNITARELGIVIGKQYWGQGLGVEAMNAVIAYLFDELGYDAVTAAYFIHNTQSARMQKKCGFEFHHKSEYRTTAGDVYETNENIITREKYILMKNNAH